MTDEEMEVVMSLNLGHASPIGTGAFINGRHPFEF